MPTIPSGIRLKSLYLKTGSVAALVQLGDFCLILTRMPIVRSQMTMSKKKVKLRKLKKRNTSKRTFKQEKQNAGKST